MSAQQPLPAVIYAALSKASDDPDQTSIESQIVTARARLEQLEQWGEFVATGTSARPTSSCPSWSASATP